MAYRLRCILVAYLLAAHKWDCQYFTKEVSVAEDTECPICGSSLDENGRCTNPAKDNPQ